MSDDNVLDDESLNSTMLTTIDNPFSPFAQFDEWMAFDTEKGYDTCNYLARIAKTSDELSDEANDLAITRAQDEIVELNILGIYKKVASKDYKDQSEISK
jgi:hypothetical protein